MIEMCRRQAYVRRSEISNGGQARDQPPDRLMVMKLETRISYHQAVRRAVERIAQSLDDALDLETVAAEACLSPFHFHRVFRGMVGETPLELSRRLRMERAAWQLATADRAVTAIAFDAGYEAHEAFTRAFRALYGTSPSGFRQRASRRYELASSNGIHFRTDGVVRDFSPRDTGGVTMDVAIERMPQLRVATIHHVGPYNQIGAAFQRLGDIAGPAGLFGTQGATMLAIYHDDPDTTPVNELRSDAGITVAADAPLPPGLDEQHLPAGRYARTTHVGSYEHLGDTWARLMGEWLPASGERVADSPSFEIYRNTPMDTPKEQLRTDVYVPLV
jgi:AraC family transcriptional regulator